MPACGVRPEAIAKAIASGSGDEADRDAGDEVVPERDPVVVAQREDRLWQPGGPLAVRGDHAMIIASRLA